MDENMDGLMRFIMDVGVNMGNLKPINGRSGEAGQ